MGPYIIRRLLYMIVVLLFVTAITFLIFFVLPTADPAALRAGRSPTPETLAAIREQLGLDKPLPEQFWVYLKALVLHFDFGNSFVNNVDVRALIFDRLPNTLFLISGAAILWFTGGVLDRDDLRDQARDRLDRARDGHRARRDLGAGLLAGPRLAVPVRERHRAVPGVPRQRRLPERRRVLREDPDADPAVDRARGGVLGGVRAPHALEPARGDVRGLRAHGAREGAHRAPRRSCATACAPRSRRS